MHKNTGQEIRAVFLYRYLYYDIEQKGSFLVLKIDASATTLNLFYTKKKSLQRCEWASNENFCRTVKNN